MKVRIRRFFNGKKWSAMVLAIFCLANRALALDTNSVITGWLASQTNLQTWNADFIQTRRLKTLKQPLRASGHLWFASPNRFRWELREPAQTTALRSGDDMFVIYPQLKRAEKYSLGADAPAEWREALALLEAGFPRDRREFDARFQLVALTETNASWQLTMSPASAFVRKMMSEIRIGLATNDFSLTSTELRFIDGSILRNDFSNGVRNAALDPALFEWKAPPDYKLVEPFGK